jgi:hypothetical protein
MGELQKALQRSFHEETSFTKFLEFQRPSRALLPWVSLPLPDLLHFGQLDLSVAIDSFMERRVWVGGDNSAYEVLVALTKTEHEMKGVALQNYLVACDEIGQFVYLPSWQALLRWEKRLI